MRIKQLYTEPATIDPIFFHEGVNIILGESDTTSSKNNGVGKSLCIEFLNFALLKRKSDSRVARIPEAAFDHDTLICVDFVMGASGYTIKRSISEAERPHIVVDGRETVFAKMDDATSFLTSQMFRNEQSRIGFREILGPLIRDERSEFKSIVSCFDTKARVPDNYAPHLMLLGINVDFYRAIKGLQKELDNIAAEENRIKESVKLVRQKSIDEARSDLNALEDEVEKIQEGIDALENAPTYDIVKGEILSIEDEMAQLRTRKEVLSRRAANLAPIAAEPSVDSDEIREFYDHLSAGLGTSIARDLDEVLSFKNKIEQFQRHLLLEKTTVIDTEVRSINKQLGNLDKRYGKLVRVLDQDGELRNLRQTYASYQAKSDEYGQLKSFISRYDQLLLDRQAKKSDIEAERLKLQESISVAVDRVRSFQRTILGIHEFIQGNRKASFEIRTTTKKHIVEIVLRIDDDGSHSVEREKVFIYDIALLLNDFTMARHPGLLVHDNIFDVDNDTLEKSLEYIVTRVPFDDGQQYILTLNVDRLERYEEEAWYDELMENVVATFTKSNRFLKTKYQEIGS
ncbi:DUF2326 domain-containing protein [Rhizobium ruizarguesonis]|uniref:DUF2326 domain-containing protein n=1 Tax=Rhizobium leguminosarum TaxID=384 RepID=A0ABD7PQQ1_RHILE|nr:MULTISPECIES: DUF2326 domain-containing protein [Rhizobium]MBY5809640.1 DUF2326 domain-containing protein [Rhizobium leguminosarum]TAW21264.1 DUF2326 domain-containing protein [Rhizobium ruizarguesonis]TAW29429.1 DUF2326 domain-containing protein [Rhizobium leguminosarum]TAW43157.1 DUF2326 domain-containing protein [Rhizobium leguminosarum]